MVPPYTGRFCDMARAAYAATGLVPGRRRYLAGCHACALTVLAIARGVVDREDDTINNCHLNPVVSWATRWAPRIWVSGFMAGFDGLRDSLSRIDHRWAAGYRVGAGVAAALFHEPHLGGPAA